MAKTKTVGRPDAALVPPMEKVKYKPLIYIAAFAIPALLALIAYAIFGVNPFGERSVLCLDLNGQYVYYFENIRRTFWSGENMLYSWARNLSGGYQGVIGYYLASPFTFIVILLPRSMIIESIMIMQLCKIGACGLTFSIYAQKSKGVRPLPSLLFSTMYALMSYVVIQTIDPMWLDGPIFLPLIILGLEYLVDDGRKINYIIPLAIMFVANFYIGFMVAIFVAIYFFYYVFFGAKRKFKGLTDYMTVIGRMILATGVVMMCSFIMIMPVASALSLGKFDFSEPDYSLKAMFNPIELIATLLPNQYYSVNVDEGTRMYGRPEIYCGVLSLVLLPLYFCNKKIKRNRKLGYGLVLFIMLFSMWVKPVNMMWHGGQDPNWLPYRYSFIMSFVIVSMAAETFANLEGYKMSVVPAASTFGGLSAIVFVFSMMLEKFNYNEDRYKYVAKLPYKAHMTINGKSVDYIFLGTLAFGLALAAIYLTLIYLHSHAKKRSQQNIIAGIMAVFVIFEAGYNTFDTFLKIDKEVYYSSRPSYTSIMSAPAVGEALKEYDGGLYRAEKTFFRNVNDNQAYDLKGISHSSSVMNARILKFIETLGYTTKTYESRYDGNTPLADSLLGIKYVIDDPANRRTGGKVMLSPYYQEVYSQPFQIENEERTIHVYENTDALPIGFMASEDILRLSFLGNDNPFNSMNNFLSSMTGSTTDYSALNPRQYFKRIATGEYQKYTVGQDYEPVLEKRTDPELLEVVLNECWESDYGGQHCYNASPNAVDPTVRIHVVTGDTEDPLYMYLKSDNPKKCNLWVCDYKDPETGEFGYKNTSSPFTGYGCYFDDYDYAIVNLGTYPPHTELEIRMTIIQNDKSGANEYIMVKDFQFYHLDYAAFHEDIQKLKASPWDVDMSKFDSNHLIGEVDAHEGEVFYTSIPYEPGWTIKVDGKKVDEAFGQNPYDEESTVLYNFPDKKGSVVILNALIGIKLEPGHHTVEMTYSPPGFKLGIILLIFGIAAVVAFFLYDREHNPVLVYVRKVKSGEIDPNAETEKPKKKKDIIKSKGAVAELDIKEATAPKKAKKSEKPEDKPETEPEEKSGKDDDGEKAVISEDDLKDVDINEINDQPKKSGSKNKKSGNKGKKKK